jgi:hypothetical protein
MKLTRGGVRSKKQLGAIPRKTLRNGAIQNLVFSLNRRLQLEAFMESQSYYCKEDINFKVYDKDCSKLKEGEFRQDIIDAIKDYNYVAFCVDDLIFKIPFSLVEIISALDYFKDVLGFSLCLGLNTNYCYMKDCKQRIPAFASDDKIFKYKWTESERDFAYPMAVTGYVYRTKDVLAMIRESYFDCPNTFESVLFQKRFKSKKYYMVAYLESVAFCAPFNKVQTKFPKNRSMGWTHEYFEKLYEGGTRIDWLSYQGLETNSIHQEVALNLKGG